MELYANDLSLERGGRILFSKLSFSLQAGQLLLIQGRNGAGKTSLLKVLAGFLTPQHGRVIWQAKDACGKRVAPEDHLFFLDHQDGVRKALSINENLQCQLALQGATATHAARAEVLAALGLLPYADRLCQQLSKGQQRKVALASLFLSQKPIWLLDEPFNALDKKSIDVTHDYFDKHLQQNGLILLASHFLDKVYPNMKTMTL